MKQASSLSAIFGKPKGSFKTENYDINETYAWFPTKGDSMTDDTDHSIPSGCFILGRLITVNSINSIWELANFMYRPLIIRGKTRKGLDFMVVKTITFISAIDRECIRLTSYNKNFKDFWMPFDAITEVFVVEQKRIKKGRSWINLPVTKRTPSPFNY